MNNNHRIPVIKTVKDALNLELVKGQLTTERMAKSNAERWAEAVESWMDSTMKRIVPDEIYKKSKMKSCFNEVQEWLKNDGYHYGVENGGWTYVLKHKDQEISRLDFKKPE